MVSHLDYIYVSAHGLNRTQTYTVMHRLCRANHGVTTAAAPATESSVTRFYTKPLILTNPASAAATASAPVLTLGSTAVPLSGCIKQYDSLLSQAKKISFEQHGLRS